MTDIKFGIQYGATADPIPVQLKKQNIRFDKEKVKFLELKREALLRLRIGGLLTDSQTDIITAKLHKQVSAQIAKDNKMTVKK